MIENGRTEWKTNFTEMVYDVEAKKNTHSTMFLICDLISRKI